MSNKVERFNVRVYGILINEANEVLLSHEHYKDFDLVKFPGGGVNLGEGLADALHREWLEELNVAIEIQDLFYINDFFVPSFLKDNSQVISIYYRVIIKGHIKKGIPESAEAHLSHKWHAIQDLHDDLLSLPIDKKVVSLLKIK